MALKKNDQPPRVAVVGVGHELRGDDGAGVWVARALKLALTERQDILVLDSGHAPENHTGKLRRFAPDLVLLVDAAQLDEPPGTVRWLAWQETSGLSASTHTMPAYVLAQYLTAELGCEVALIGLQWAHMNFGEAMSPPVQHAVVEIVSLLSDAL
jgi:hydrogenase 3 maturation protease